MLQNHLLQLLCLVAVEPPSQFERLMKASSTRTTGFTPRT